MYTLIIVDDEYASRELLKKYVVDYCKDFEIAGIFTDGDEAIEYLSENDVDLVITDIKMPRVSGIELVKYIYGEKPYINVIAVSAYSEFEYAKILMKYGAAYYLLKFVDIDEFLEAIEIVRGNIASKKSLISGQYDELQVEMFFYDLFENNFSSCEEAAENYHEIEKDGSFEAAECLKLSVTIDNLGEFLATKWNYTEEMFKNAILNVIKLLNPALSVTSLGFCENKISFIIFNHGDAVFISIQNIIKEIEATFGLKATAFSEENMLLKSVYLGDYGESESTEAKINSLDLEGLKLPDIIKSAIKIIEENYSIPIIRSEIAEQLHINVVYLSKLFKKHTGKTLMTYLFEFRMEKAKELVLSEKTINEICERVGYGDERAFRRAFKKYTGYSVREYKKSLSHTKREF